MFGIRGARSNEETSDLSDRLVTLQEPNHVASEGYRTLRTNLFYSVADVPPKVIIITSANPREGKSTTCANLGVVLAQAGKQTLLLDCDLRKPVIHNVFGFRNLRGLMDVLVGQHRLQDVWHEPVPGLKIVPTGPMPSNPAEVLSSRRFADLIATARGDFDYVIIDASPIGPVSDPAILAAQGDGVILVLDAQNTRKASVRKSVRSLEAVRAHLLGTVMNNVKVSNARYYGYGSSYYG